VLYSRVASRYLSAARDLKRLGAVSRSPIYDQFSTVLVGLVTIRAFDRMQFYIERCFDLLDARLRAMWYTYYCRRWMEIRMGALAVLFMMFVTSSIILDGVNPSLAGFTLSFALQYSSTVLGILLRLSSIEVSSNSVERIVEYADMPTEESRDAKPAVAPPAAWPTAGTIEVENLTVGYADHLPPALVDLGFSIKPGQRVGIVGRTGAGKSSLALAFFRLLEPRRGSIRIDNLDISTLKRDAIRKRMSIIPQDPFLFSGTLRSNLDFEGCREDYELIEALRMVQLIGRGPSQDRIPESSTNFGRVDGELSTRGNDTAESDLHADSRVDFFSNLSTPIAAGGKNLSQGQRQLVCLARALLVRPKIVVLDEATSAVDSDTAALALQEALSIFPADSTILIIAHRLSTVATADQVIVLSEGRLSEMGTPRELMEKGEDGAFWNLVQQSSERDALIETILGTRDSDI
jgi:ABC-type multidrug transport system fused ATPase/permease subunit